MNISKTSLACILVLTFSNIAAAEIYESKDAQGNPVFTDSPTTMGDEKVELAPTNIADAPPKVPEAPAAPTAPDAPAAATVPGQQGDVVIIGGDDQLEDALAGRRRNEVIDAEGRREVLDAEAPHDVLDAETRHEAGDGGPVDDRTLPQHEEGAHRVARPHVGPGRR